MPKPRHARPPEPRRAAATAAAPAPAPAVGRGRHRSPRATPPGRPAVVGVAVLAVTTGGWSVHRLADGGAVDLAAAEVVQQRIADASAEARRAALERAPRAEERAEIKAAQGRARVRLEEIRARDARLERERQARTARQRCARAESVLARLGLDAVQRRHVAIIVDLARRLDLPPRAAVVATAAAWQESRLRNLDHGVADSIGMFQQRPSMGWGSNAQLQDPRYATRKFYERLVEVRGWRRMSVGDAAQAVQASAYPRAYARWTTAAADAVRALDTLRTHHTRC